MNTEFLPSGIKEFLSGLSKPEIWEKASGMALSIAVILVLSRILQVVVGRALKKTMPEPRAQMIRKGVPDGVERLEG